MNSLISQQCGFRDRCQSGTGVRSGTNSGVQRQGSSREGDENSTRRTISNLFNIQLKNVSYTSILNNLSYL